MLKKEIIINSLLTCIKLFHLYSFRYLANDILQKCKKKGNNYNKEFTLVFIIA